MYENKLSKFASPEWTCIPFEIHPPNVFDQMVTILVDVEACLATAHELIPTHDLAGRAKLELRASAEATVAKLLRWERQFVPPLTIQEMNGIFEEKSWPSVPSPSPPTRPDTAHDTFPSSHFASMPEAALLSLYHAACIVVSNLGPVMMVPQLKMASVWGVDESQRVRAMHMLKRVGQHQNFALGDIGDLQDAYFASVASWVVAHSRR